MAITTEFPSQHSALGDIVRRRKLLLSIVSCYLLVGALIGSIIGLDFWPKVQSHVSGGLYVLRYFLFLFGGIYLVWRFAVAAFRVKPKKPIQWFVNDLRSTFLGPSNLLEGAICFLAITIFIAGFAFFKNLIPIFNPFAWDPYFSALDRSIHGGADPWTLIWSVFGSPIATYLLSLAYHIWFVVVYLAIFVAAFDRKNPARGAEFLIAFLLTCIVGGTIMAMVFSSGGPVYFEAFGYGDTYTEQLRKLETVGRTYTLWVLDVQDSVLLKFREDGISLISAMPSMHVASSVVIALFGFSYSRLCGWLLSAFALCVMIGSVHLAWHYAVDGYIGAATAFGCWLSAKSLVRKFGEG